MYACMMVLVSKSSLGILPPGSLGPCMPLVPLNGQSKGVTALCWGGNFEDPALQVNPQFIALYLWGARWPHTAGGRRAFRVFVRRRHCTRTKREGSRTGVAQRSRQGRGPGRGVAPLQVLDSGRPRRRGGVGPVPRGWPSGVFLRRRWTRWLGKQVCERPALGPRASNAAVKECMGKRVGRETKGLGGVEVDLGTREGLGHAQRPRSSPADTHPGSCSQRPGANTRGRAAGLTSSEWGVRSALR